jgi:hypothetical protein
MACCAGYRICQTRIDSSDLYFAPAEKGSRSYACAFERGVIKFKQVAAVAAATRGKIGRGGADLHLLTLELSRADMQSFFAA